MTVKDIFDMAIHLMDEQNEDNGQPETIDTQEYKFRTISILNSVLPALAPYGSRRWKGKDNPALLVQGSYSKPDMDQGIPLDDTLCAALLPYYLAGMLLAGENEELSAVFMNRYQLAFADLRGKQAATFEQVMPAYGLF